MALVREWSAEVGLKGKVVGLWKEQPGAASDMEEPEEWEGQQEAGVAGCMTQFRSQEELIQGNSFFFLL